jgi:hypothetical protein
MSFTVHPKAVPLSTQKARGFKGYKLRLTDIQSIPLLDVVSRSYFLDIK